jgi:hypothetical protein
MVGLNVDGKGIYTRRHICKRQQKFIGFLLVTRKHKNIYCLWWKLFITPTV